MCDDGDCCQALDNPQLRAYLGMEGRTGVRIRGVAPTAPAAALLRTGDVLVEPDGSQS